MSRPTTASLENFSLRSGLGNSEEKNERLNFLILGRKRYRYIKPKKS